MKHLKITSAIIPLALTIGLVGCGSSDDDDKTADTSEIPALVKRTNFDATVVYREMSDYSQQTALVRFDTSSQIPIYYVSTDGSNPPASIENGVKVIEQRLGDIFTDFNLITDDVSVFKDGANSSENVGNGTYDPTAFKLKHGIVNGLVFSVGSGYYSNTYSNDPQNMCANASDAPYSGGLTIKIDANTHLYDSNHLGWVNMGNGQCNWDAEMVTHETAHSMGMFAHIEPYFGLWSPTAMNILATIYNNPAGTPYHSLLVDYK